MSALGGRRRRRQTSRILSLIEAGAAMTVSEKDNSCPRGLPIILMLVIHDGGDGVGGLD